MKGKMKLEHCPFCGELPKVTKNMPIKGLVSISCENRNCGVHPHVVEYNRKSAANKWNNRADAWIPVGEGLPVLTKEQVNDGFVRKSVLISKKGSTRVFIAHFDIEDNNFYEDINLSSSIYADVTAWQPLSKKYVGGAE